MKVDECMGMSIISSTTITYENIYVFNIIYLLNKMYYLTFEYKKCHLVGIMMVMYYTTTIFSIETLINFMMIQFVCKKH